MTGFVVAEGELDCKLVELVLGACGFGSIKVVAGGGRSSAVSLACSILCSRRQPVALVVDAYTVVDRLSHSQEQDLESLLRYSAPDELWRVVLCKPEIEIVFFESPETLAITERIFGVHLSERQSAVAHYDPRAILAEIGGTHSRSWQTALGYLTTNAEACRRLGTGPTLAPLVSFFRALEKAAAEAAASRRTASGAQAAGRRKTRTVRSSVCGA